MVEHGEIHMAGGDMAQRKKRDAHRAGAHAELRQRTGNVRGDVAMSEHGTFRGAGGAGGVDDGREVVWRDGAGLSFDIRRQRGRSQLQDFCHGHAFGPGRRFRRNLNRVHHYDFFELRLRQNR